MWQRGGGVTGQLELPPPLWMISMGTACARALRSLPAHCGSVESVRAQQPPGGSVHTHKTDRRPPSHTRDLWVARQGSGMGLAYPFSCPSFGWHRRCAPERIAWGHQAAQGALTQHSAELTGLPALRPSLGGREPAHLQDMGAGGEQEEKLRPMGLWLYPGAAVLIPPGAQVLPVSAASTGEV